MQLTCSQPAWQNKSNNLSALLFTVNQDIQYNKSIAKICCTWKYAKNAHKDVYDELRAEGTFRGKKFLRYIAQWLC